MINLEKLSPGDYIRRIVTGSIICVDNPEDYRFLEENYEHVRVEVEDRMPQPLELWLNIWGDGLGPLKCSAHLSFDAACADVRAGEAIARLHIQTTVGHFDVVPSDD